MHITFANEKLVTIANNKEEENKKIRKGPN